MASARDESPLLRQRAEGFCVSWELSYQVFLDTGTLPMSPEFCQEKNGVFAIFFFGDTPQTQEQQGFRAQKKKLGKTGK